MTLWALHHGGPKLAIVVSSVLIFAGNWIRYGATRSGTHGNFAGVMFGQVLTGFAQPFVLSAPTRYSDLWFTNRGRVAATAVMSLSNAFGGALAQLIDPFWATAPHEIPNMILYVAILVSILHFWVSRKLKLIFHLSPRLHLYPHFSSPPTHQRHRPHLVTNPNNRFSPRYASFLAPLSST
jgi:MFS family permease